MKVRILSGSQAGAVVEQEQTEAESNISTGFAEAVTDGFVEWGPGPGLPVLLHQDQVIPAEAEPEKKPEKAKHGR